MCYVYFGTRNFGSKRPRREEQGETHDHDPWPENPVNPELKQFLPPYHTNNAASICNRVKSTKNSNSIHKLCVVHHAASSASQWLSPHRTKKVADLWTRNHQQYQEGALAYILVLVDCECILCMMVMADSQIEHIIAYCPPSTSRRTPSPSLSRDSTSRKVVVCSTSLYQWRSVTRFVSYDTCSLCRYSRKSLRNLPSILRDGSD